jgi:hypothetical protein
LLAEQIDDHPEIVRGVARHMAMYALDAREHGLPSVPSFAAFDLGVIAVDAYECKSPAASDVLESALSITSKGMAEDMVIEARIKLGASLLALEETTAAERVKSALVGIEESRLRACAQDLIDAPRAFHEVTDRQLDLRWIPAERHASVSAFVALCVKG